MNKAREVIGKGFKAGVSKADIAQSRKRFKTFAEALRAEETIVVDNKRIFQSTVKIKGKNVTRWRDNKGRFTKNPNLIRKTTKFGGT